MDEVDIATAYDTIFGYLLSTPDLYARASLVRHLDTLFFLARKAVGSAGTVEEKATSSPSRKSESASSATVSDEGWKEHAEDESHSESTKT